MMALTNEQIAEIRKRVEASTQGVWFTVHDTDICVEEPPGSGEVDSVGYTISSYDAEFIAHAREDVPKLVAEIERLKAELSRLNEELEDERLQQRADAERTEYYAED